MNQRKKANHQSLFVKLKALEQLTEKNLTTTQIAKELNVDPSTIRKWRKKEKLIKEQRNRFIGNTLQRKRILRKSLNAEVDEALWKWFQEKRLAGIALSNRMIQEQALLFNEEFKGNDSFKASKGWLKCWQQRYGIKDFTVSGKDLAATASSSPEPVDELPKYINENNLSADQVFNCDERVLSYKMLPKTDVCEHIERCLSSLKGYRDEITVMACRNASGTLKMPLVVIGKSPQPRAIKNIKKTLPVSYKSSPTDWTTGPLFANWFADEFVPQVKRFLESAGLPQKALLLVDNCSANATAIENDGIEIRTFPSNDNSSAKSKTHGCLDNLELLYQQKLMAFILDNVKGKTLTECLKGMTIKHAIDWLASEWDDLSKTVLQNSWTKVWPWDPRKGDCGAYQAQQKATERILQHFNKILTSLPEYKNSNRLDFIKSLQNPSSPVAHLLEDSEVSNVQNDEGEMMDPLAMIEERNVNGISSINDAKSCVNQLLDYCNRNNYSEESIDALHILRCEIRKRMLSD